MRKWIIIGILIIIGVLTYQYVYQDHRDISKEDATFSLSTADLITAFSKEPELSETKYLNKTIEIKGKVTDANSETVTLDTQVFCQFIEPIDEILTEKGTLTIKGRFIGYDDLLEEIKLDQCIVVKK